MAEIRDSRAGYKHHVSKDYLTALPHTTQFSRLRKNSYVPQSKILQPFPADICIVSASKNIPLNQT